MFVAYLVPKEDTHLVVEDGLGYIAIGATKEEAEAAVRNLFDKEQQETIARSVAAGYEEEPPMAWDEGHVLHCNKV